MLIPLKPLLEKYNLNIKGVVQVGAHFAEEHDIYVQLGIKNIVYIEPCRDAYEKTVEKMIANGNVFFKYGINMSENMAKDMRRAYGGDGSKFWKSGVLSNDYPNGINVINYACGESESEMEMYVSHNNQGQSNSLLKPQLHTIQHPEVVFTDKELVAVMPLDNLGLMDNYNLLVMDVQGAEGLVLKGATETLKHIDCIYTEVNTDQTYEGNMLVGEMDEFLSEYGFVRVETLMPSPNWSWGDAVYVKMDKTDAAFNDMLEWANEYKVDYSKKWFLKNE